MLFGKFVLLTWETTFELKAQIYEFHLRFTAAFHAKMPLRALILN